MHETVRQVVLSSNDITKFGTVLGIWLGVRLYVNQKADSIADGPELRADLSI